MNGPVDQGPKVCFSRPAVDPLFHTAAKVYGPRLLGIILTGNGRDGSDGLREIKAAGGITLVQDPNDATAKGMPRSALQESSADFIASLSDMTAILVSLVMA